MIIFHQEYHPNETKAFFIQGSHSLWFVLSVSVEGLHLYLENTATIKL